jgi:LSD1 subclass zinc finger protein
VSPATRWIGFLLCLAGSAGLPSPALARDPALLEELRAAYPDTLANGRRNGSARPAALPDIFGPGAVLNVGNVFMKITNNGILGNGFQALSSDPAMQWPGASGIEYLTNALVGVAGVNPLSTDPAAVRRVSYSTEWRPPTLEPEDRIYRAFDGIANGQRLTNDDGDVDPRTGSPRIDEDYLDGRDNDGDGRIDEDYAAVGQQMFTCVMRDDTPAAVNVVNNERHVPLGIEIKQTAWAYSVDGYQDFNPIEFVVTNRSGHMLDSMYFGLRTDMDCGPNSSSTFFSDDLDVPSFPSGEFVVPVLPIDPRLQLHPVPGTDRVDTLCSRLRIRINGTSVVDDDGDEGHTPGVASLLLLGHTLDPLGVTAPSRVGFRMLRSFIFGTPFQSGGNAVTDQQRYELMSGTDNIDPETGAVTLEQGDQLGDYLSFMSVGPFCNVPDGGSFRVTVAYAVAPGSRTSLDNFRGDYGRYQAGQLGALELFAKYPALANAFATQVAYEGTYELPRPGFEDQVPNCHGCETPIQLPRGTPSGQVCHQCGDQESECETVTEFATTWFNFDCDYCTGVWDEATSQGFYLRRWNAESPPPTPGLNVATNFNYNANPDRGPALTPAGDKQVTIAWNNLSETTPDPKTHWFDFRSYRVWKVANWRRPVGSSGPQDDEWALLGEFRRFDYAPSNRIRVVNPTNLAETLLVCPTIWIPERAESMQVCLDHGDLWNREDGTVIRPDPSVDCVREAGECVQDSGLVLGSLTEIERRTRYPVGRYRLVDRDVKNGFIYFYAVTAGDSVGTSEFFGRVSGVESEAVIPQASTGPSGGVWVVPNPYRGYSDIAQRSSSWDLTPNASDPTGTHIDFMGLPTGRWTIRIYTVAGDLVAELHSDDPINSDLRPAVVGSDGVLRPGHNQQQDNANDGQARWNLISRNGQDVVSGIYVFVVNADQGQQRGRFVVIR